MGPRISRISQVSLAFYNSVSMRCFLLLQMELNSFYPHFLMSSSSKCDKSTEERLVCGWEEFRLDSLELSYFSMNCIWLNCYVPDE